MISTSYFWGSPFDDDRSTGEILVGIDVGQKRDPSAICVVEAEDRSIGRRKVAHYLVRHLERLPIGTSFLEIARRASKVAIGVRQWAVSAPAIFVNVTGMGQPLVDLFEEEDGIEWVTPVYFTHGDQRTKESNQVRLGKAYLVSRLKTLLQTGRLHLPRNSETETLRQELLDFEIQIDEKANERYGAFRVGIHDDFVTALGMAVQEDPGRLESMPLDFL